MSEGTTAAEQEVRMETFHAFKEIFASAPIRLMSRTVSHMRALGYDDLASAIGDLDWKTVPPDDPVDPTLRQDWSSTLLNAFEHVGSWIQQLSAQPMGYNLDSVGYRPATTAWAAMWSSMLGIRFENPPQKKPQVFVFHGGNQAIQAALLGIAEAHRERLGPASPPTVLVPLPSFSCPLDQIALQGMKALLLPPTDPGMDPSPADLEQIPDGVDIDGVYTMPINNPTGRTVPPEQMRAFVDAVLERWPHAGIILDSVYVRLHPRYREILSWYNEDPRYRDAVMFVDSLSKTHGVTGLRAGALLCASERLSAGALRYAQNVVAGPSNTMQAVILSLLAPFLTGDDDLAESRGRLQQRIGLHLQRRRRLLLRETFATHRALLDEQQPVLPDPVTYDWQGSMYADLRLSPLCHELAARHNVSPTVAFYLETGVGGVPLSGFCSNGNLERHGLIVNADSDAFTSFREETSHYVRLSFGMTPPPRE